jgi:hypothetical protein
MTRILERRIAADRSWPRLRWLVSVLALSTGAWGCTERVSAPRHRPGSDLQSALATSDMHFLRPRTGAPAFVSLSASFYAKLGEDRSVAIYYHATPGAADSVKFLDFRVFAGSLATSPEGRTYLPRDSVLITVTITDPARMQVQFEPSGLKFSTASPAQLELSFREADDDLNADGVMDAQDTALKEQLAIWVQESPGGLWTKLSSALFLDLEELVADVAGFSGYAAAY